MTEMTTTTTETIRGRHGVAFTWAEIVDGVFVKSSLSVKTDKDENYLFVRNPDHLLDIIIAAQELLAAIKEKTTDA